LLRRHFSAILVSYLPAWFEFAVIHPWLPSGHLAFGQLFDVCCAAPSSSVQHIHQILYHHQPAAFSSRLRVVGVPWHTNNQFTKLLWFNLAGILVDCTAAISHPTGEFYDDVPSHLHLAGAILGCHITPKSGAFVDSFLITAPPFFIRMVHLLFATPPFGHRPCQ
jgi:hypothetical protein